MDIISDCLRGIKNLLAFVYNSSDVSRVTKGRGNVQTTKYNEEFEPRKKKKAFQPRGLQILRLKRKCQSCSERRIRKLSSSLRFSRFRGFPYSIFHEFRCYRELSITTIFLGGSIEVRKMNTDSSIFEENCFRMELLKDNELKAREKDEY